MVVLFFFDLLPLLGVVFFFSIAVAVPLPIDTVLFGVCLCSALGFDRFSERIVRNREEEAERGVRVDRK